jgi:hypothetical protein
VLCSQDVAGEARLGSWMSESVGALWCGAELNRARERHSQLHFDDYPLCRRCREWFRP